MYRITLKTHALSYYEVEELVTKENIYYKVFKIYHVHLIHTKQVDKLLFLKGIMLEENTPKYIDKGTFDLLRPYTYSIIYSWYSLK